MGMNTQEIKKESTFKVFFKENRKKIIIGSVATVAIIAVIIGITVLVNSFRAKKIIAELEGVMFEALVEEEDSVALETITIKDGKVLHNETKYSATRGEPEGKVTTSELGPNDPEINFHLFGKPKIYGTYEIIYSGGEIVAVESWRGERYERTEKSNVAVMDIITQYPLRSMTDTHIRNLCPEISKWAPTGEGRYNRDNKKEVYFENVDDNGSYTLMYRDKTYSAKYEGPYLISYSVTTDSYSESFNEIKNYLSSVDELDIDFYDFFNSLKVIETNSLGGKKMECSYKHFDFKGQTYTSSGDVTLTIYVNIDKAIANAK